MCEILICESVGLDTLIGYTSLSFGIFFRLKVFAI